jgi:uncharacterized membrane protein YecN with MAPEG domain
MVAALPAAVKSGWPRQDAVFWRPSARKRIRSATMNLPITTLYAGLLGLLLLALSMAVSRHRMRARVSLGTGNDPQLERAVRAHGNFVEYVPFALILLALAEAQAAPGWLVHALGAALLLGRLLHVWGMSRPDGLGQGRRFGIALTWLMILAASLTDLCYVLLG